MEGAGASNVSRAAETRGMDSADEAPELPSAVQDLIRRLEGKGEPITDLPELSEKEFWDFFPKIASPATITGWRSQVRLQVLEAIGNCNTFESLDVDIICGGDISRLTESEWEVVFRGFKSSTVLETISLWDLEWSSDAEVESLCSQIGRMLNSSSVKKLRIVDTNLSEETVGILSQALIQSSSLKVLALYGVKWGEALLLNALARDDGNRSIERLWLQRMDGLGGCLREVLTSNPSLKEVRLNNLRMSSEEWRQLGEFIRDNAIATNTQVSFDGKYVGDNWESIETLARAASSNVKDPTVELVLCFLGDDELMLSLNLLGRVLRGEIKSLKSFSIMECRSSGANQDRPESFLSMKGQTGEASVLKRLGLHVEKEDAWKEVWKELLLCLRGNTSLTHLELSSSRLDEEAFRDLMGLLQVNLTLQEIDLSRTPWERDGKGALIQAALKQNQKRAAYMSVFVEAKLKFGDAKAGRLFLCGSPLAGKTQLRLTLVHGTNWVRKKWAKFKWRTEGIEVEFLQNNDESQISVWDLAGQEIFRTLQSVLFPQTNNFCVFLFVYSPFCQKKKIYKEESCFERELEEWLSFITSSTRVTGLNLPQVLVVISHKDKARCKSLNWAHFIMVKLAKRFARFVDLRPIQEFFHVDTRETEQVILLKNHIFEIFRELLSEKSPRVPQLCTQLSHHLVKKTKKNRKCPLWSSKKFHNFCTPILIKFCPYSSPHSRIMKSIISYLNDVGSIISIPNLDYIIVDPNWLTNKLLGELVSLGQNFQAQEHKRTSPDSYSSKDGFVSESVFAGLIEEFLRKQPHGQKGVDRELIENILINLDLCFKVEDTSQYFIPSFIPEHASTEGQKPQEEKDLGSMAWESRGEHASSEGQKPPEEKDLESIASEPRRETSQFVGIRIQCQDGRTMSLTAAFFPCFQMFMRRKLISEMCVSKKLVTCFRHYLRLFLDGHEIYVEQGKSHNYVDVLMLLSKHKSRSKALQYLMKHIVKELISFCASSKGCPGVALVLGVIQTHCVEKLIPSHLRGAILIEELKSNFIRDINDKLEDIQLDRFHLVKEEELFSYEHSWDAIGGHTGVISERARDLLWENDVEAVVNEIQQKRMQQLGSLQQGLNEVNKDLIHSYPEMKDSNRPSSRCLSRESTSVESREIRDALERIEKKVDGVDERLRLGLQRLEMKMGQILSLQQEFLSTLSDFMSKVDRIIEYPLEFQQTRAPKRPYVTDDVNIFYRMSAKLHVGITVRLHLMCESETGFHLVKDQEGLKIRFDRENCGWIRKTIEISFKLMYYAAKAGLDATLGVGQAIPDWGDLKSDIVKLDGISDRDRRAVLKGGESMELEEAWLRIQQTLAPRLRDNYSSIFKLYQVKYVRLELGGHAWVCEECMEKGRRSGILTN
ncbi:hypothetical protein MPTK2_3g20675 [Marchantia polymorpha subsp. ruderalis]